MNFSVFLPPTIYGHGHLVLNTDVNCKQSKLHLAIHSSCIEKEAAKAAEKAQSSVSSTPAPAPIKEPVVPKALKGINPKLLEKIRAKVSLECNFFQKDSNKTRVAEPPDFRRLRLRLEPFKNKTALAPAPAPGEL